MTLSPFDLNLRHLRAVLAVNDCGSISRASSAVNLSQPAITQGLARLESQLQHELFERRADGMVATEIGEMFTQRIRTAIEHLSIGGKQVKNAPQLDRLITMTQMRAFLSLTDARSFISAAKQAGLSQTAVHKAVCDLEHIIGTRLAERRSGGTRLNAVGKRLSRAIRLSISEIAAAIDDLDIENHNPLIAVGGMPLSRTYLLPKGISRMAMEEPRSRFEVVEGNWRELVEPLRDGVIDMVIGALRPFEIKDLHQEPLYENHLVVASGARHPLAAMEETPSLDVLASYPWLVSRVDSPLRDQWETMFKDYPLTQKPIECASVMIVSRILADNNFLTLLSPDQVEIQIRSGLLACVGQPLLESRRIIGITTRRSWRPTVIQSRFIELLREASEERKHTELSWV